MCVCGSVGTIYASVVYGVVLCCAHHAKWCHLLLLYTHKIDEMNTVEKKRHHLLCHGSGLRHSLFSRSHTISIFISRLRFQRVVHRGQRLVFVVACLLLHHLVVHSLTASARSALAEYTGIGLQKEWLTHQRHWRIPPHGGSTSSSCERGRTLNKEVKCIANSVAGDKDAEK